MKRKNTTNLISFLPAVLLAVMIFCFSAQPSTDSSDLSKTVTAELLRAASGAFDLHLQAFQIAAFVAKYEHLVRKAAHFTEYFVFALALSHGFARNGIDGRKRFFLTVLVIFLYAGSDEIHQLYVPGRSGQFRDVCIDTAGGAAGSLLCVLHSRRIRRRSRKTIRQSHD
ncbi:MAG: VanZ family protein [Lachnospiraceae bacterium]|nr:VanZ family protein [Lachnospiraceae bacterium]